MKVNATYDDSLESSRWSGYASVMRAAAFTNNFGHVYEPGHVATRGVNWLSPIPGVLLRPEPFRNEVSFGRLRIGYRPLPMTIPGGYLGENPLSRQGQLRRPYPWSMK